MPSGTPTTKAAKARHAKPLAFNLWRLLSLRSDQAGFDVIDVTIRDNTRLAGTNLWVLIFAIVIASVGLNVNSTAVIIGAMLISPLMGPIIGIGYGAGIHDYALIRQSFRNLGVFIGISLLASTTYFLLTPLTQAHSELFARTSPTLWDVLIAFFGGAAGMVGLTRKEKTTLIPGVAIATALMPPLCTTGYGIATGQPQFFLGAFYLFLINGVFIALASLTITRILRLPHHAFPDEAARRRGHILIATAVTVTLVPSIYLAYQLVHEEIFAANAERFILAAFQNRDDVTLLAREIDPKARSMVLTTIGQGAKPALELTLNTRLAAMGLEDATLKIRHPSEAKLDINSLKKELQRDVLRTTAMTSEQNAARIAALEARLAELNTTFAELTQVENEIRAQLPALKKVLVTGTAQDDANGKHHITVLVAIDSPGRLPASETERLKRWLKTRMPNAEIHIVVGKLSP
jgi:uncharacterized hydrophobic protein (TIGR00271 family)